MSIAELMGVPWMQNVNLVTIFWSICPLISLYHKIKKGELSWMITTTLLIDRVKTKSNLSLYLLYYAVACNEFAGLISASLRPGNTASLKQMWQRWRAIGNTVFNFSGSRFEPLTSCSRDERVIARTTGGTMFKANLQLIKTKEISALLGYSVIKRFLMLVNKGEFLPLGLKFLGQLTSVKKVK